jgi:hypothetical protein
MVSGPPLKYSFRTICTCVTLVILTVFILSLVYPPYTIARAKADDAAKERTDHLTIEYKESVIIKKMCMTHDYKLDTEEEKEAMLIMCYKRGVDPREYTPDQLAIAILPSIKAKWYEVFTSEFRAELCGEKCHHTFGHAAESISQNLFMVLIAVSIVMIACMITIVKVCTKKDRHASLQWYLNNRSDKSMSLFTGVPNLVDKQL